ncbi:unnamed protein product [Alopecurus aequalis]
MASTWVLLKRRIYFEHDASASGGSRKSGEELMGGASTGGSGEKSVGGASAGGSGEESVGGSRKESVGGASGSGKEPMCGAGGIARGVPSPQDIADAILGYLQSLKPDARFAYPPELSALRILRPTKSIPRLCGGVMSAFIASADKNLVALYAGPYRPGTNLKGGYLIYDANKNTLSTIPKPPYDYSRDELGVGAVVVDLVDTYLLCELTKIRNSEPLQAALCTWEPSSPGWTVEVASFPPELSPPNYFFNADMCFSYQGSLLCWVDLFKGMVVYDMVKKGLVFSFIPLPPECMAYDSGSQRFEQPRRAEEYRSITCVGGCIKLVTMDGYGQRPGHELSLTIWTLSMDPNNRCWNQVNQYYVKDIWESKAYLSSGLPKIVPSFPVLSRDEDDVVFLVVTHRNMALDGKVEYKDQHLLSVDIRHNKVSLRPHNTEQMDSQLLASECSAYLQCLEDHKVKARKVGASGKRVML